MSSPPVSTLSPLPAHPGTAGSTEAAAIPTPPAPSRAAAATTDHAAHPSVWLPAVWLVLAAVAAMVAAQLLLPVLLTLLGSQGGLASGGAASGVAAAVGVVPAVGLAMLCGTLAIWALQRGWAGLQRLPRPGSDQPAAANPGAKPGPVSMAPEAGAISPLSVSSVVQVAPDPTLPLAPLHRLVDSLPGRALLLARAEVNAPWLLLYGHDPANGSRTLSLFTQLRRHQLPPPAFEAWLAAQADWPVQALRLALGLGLGLGSDDAPLTPPAAPSAAADKAPVHLLPLDLRHAIAWCPPPADIAADPAGASADEERDAFVYAVSHDLRAPIRVIEGFARILQEDYGATLDKVGQDHLDRVLGASGRMTGMIDALLSLSRLSTRPLASEPVDLSGLAEAVLDELRATAPERQVDWLVEPGLKVQGDATLLRMLLENLLGNAWK
ncbi:MAG: hypothetical protein RLY71_4249, partial [Pseudomonadota bacterium]